MKVSTTANLKLSSATFIKVMLLLGRFGGVKKQDDSSSKKPEERILEHPPVPQANRIEDKDNKSFVRQQGEQTYARLRKQQEPQYWAQRLASWAIRQHAN